MLISVWKIKTKKRNRHIVSKFVKDIIRSAPLLLAAAIDFDIKCALNAVNQVSAISTLAILKIDDLARLLIDQLSEGRLSLVGSHARLLDRIRTGMREGLILDLLIELDSKVVVGDDTRMVLKV